MTQSEHNRKKVPTWAFKHFQRNARIKMRKKETGNQLIILYPS